MRAKIYEFYIKLGEYYRTCGDRVETMEEGEVLADILTMLLDIWNDEK